MKQTPLETLTLQTQQNLDLALEQVSDVITRDFLCALSDPDRYELCRPSFEDLDLDLAENACFFRLDRLVLNQPERFLEQLSTVLSVATAVQGSVAAVFHSDGARNTLYLGVISKRFRGTRWAARRASILHAVSGALESNLSGSRLTLVDTDEVLPYLCTPTASGAVCTVSGIPALKSDLEQHRYLQGLEHLADALRGLRYSIVFLADPVAPEEIAQIRQGYEALYSQLSPFAAQEFSWSSGESQTVSENQARTLTESLNRSLGLTQTAGTSTGTSKGWNAGVNAHLGVFAGIAAGVGVSLGFSSSRSTSHSHSTARQSTVTTGRSTGWTEGSSRSEGITQNHSVQLKSENRTARGLMERIDRHLQRLELCENLGALEGAAYIVAPDQNTAVAVAGNYSALLQGRQSGEERTYLNVWSDPEPVSRLTEYLSHAAHPRFRRKGGNERLFVTPVTLLHSQEAAQQLFFPQKPMDGIPVLPMAAFGRNLPAPARSFRLGELLHLGQGQNQPVTLDLEQLTAHTFLTGSTGAGKSNAVYQLLGQAMAQHIPFLVIEPAKGEYKDVFGTLDGVSVFGTNPQKMPLLRLNPFSFPDDVHVLEHIDRLAELFNACWPMYAAMPAILKEAMEQAYRSCGWDLLRSDCPDGCFPTFRDLLEALPGVIAASQYSADTSSDYRGALLTRVRSLTNGIYGQLFCTDGELEPAQLFDQSAIVDLSRVGSSETKALLMGVLLMKLQEYRMSRGGRNTPLRHLTVLEEAHTLLRQTSTSQSQESANLQGKAVEMLANAIAEMRTYGEGFLIADQAPCLLDRSVIRNTNTKIILRLPDQEDRQLVGHAANLSKEQITELARLPVGVAAVFQNHWLEPVLCQIPRVAIPESPYRYAPPPEQPDTAPQSLLLRRLLDPGAELRELDEVQRAALRRWITHLHTGREVTEMLFQAAASGWTPDSQETDYLLYCMVRGKHLIEEVRQLADRRQLQSAADRQIADRLHISETLAAEVRKRIFQYAARHIGTETPCGLELLEDGGVR